MEEPGGLGGGIEVCRIAEHLIGAGERGDGGSFSVLENGNDLVLDFNAVPEPGTWALLLVGTGLLGLTLRHRCLRA